jgi:hypothetical protein
MLKDKFITKNRIELLKFIIDVHLEKITNPEKSYEKITSGYLMIKLIEAKLLDETNVTENNNRLTLHLESFALSGELEKYDSEYIVKGKALQTLEEYEENERRHKDSIRIQIILAVLTGIIAFMPFL